MGIIKLKKHIKQNIMSKDKKKQPNPVGKKGPSDYQAGKTSTAKTEINPFAKKPK
jgi:hypothetical protein